MPITASIYALCLCLIMIESVHDSLKAREPAWFVALDAAADLTILVMFVGYWFRSVAYNLGWAAPCLFIASLVWTFSWTPYQMKRAKRTLTGEAGELYNRHNGVVNGLALLLAFPAYWFGALAAFNIHERT